MPGTVAISSTDAARSRFADAADSFESIVSAVDACYQSLMADAAPAQRFAGRTHPGGTNTEHIPEDYTGGDIYFLLDRLPAMPGVTAPEGSVAHFLQTKREVERVVNEGFSQAFDDPPGWVDKAGDDPVPLVEIKPWDLDSKELLASKPSNSPSFRRWWEKENGKIYIRDDDVWVFVDRNGVAVPYPGGEPDFALAGVVQMRVNIVRFHSYAVDRRAARKKMGVQPPDTVLHHSREYGIIEVVDKTIHRKFTHIGWMAKIRAIKRKTEKGNKTG